MIVGLSPAEDKAEIENSLLYLLQLFLWVLPQTTDVVPSAEFFFSVSYLNYLFIWLNLFICSIVNSAAVACGTLVPW